MKFAFLLLAFLAVVVGAAVLFFNNSTETTTQTDAANWTTATDSTETVTFQYPSDWEIVPYVWERCCHGGDPGEPDWSTTSKPITLRPANADERVRVQIKSEIVPDVSREVWLKSQHLTDRDLLDPDQFNTFVIAERNGINTIYNKTKFVGPSEVEQYVRHRYILIQEDQYVLVSFEEMYDHAWPEEAAERNYDASEYFDEFKRIVDSVLFVTE